MSLLDNAMSALEKGVGYAGSAVDAAASFAGGIAMENAPFMRGFAQCCEDGFEQGWHEANGGNLSYRLTEEECQQVRGRQLPSVGDWVALDEPCPAMGGSMFLVTAAGKHLRNVSRNLEANCGIVELDEEGAAYRQLWGFADGARPTSELDSHILVHGVRSQQTAGASRVLYHTHPANIAALTMVVPATSKDITQVLWRSMTECIVALSQGVSVLPWMVPGGVDIARATADAMGKRPAVIWAHHGMFASAADFDTAFGMIHTAEKAAGVYLTARAANGGSADFASTISDSSLRQIAAELGFEINEDMLG